MIRGVHAMLYSPKAEELRAFLRDQLDLPFTDTGEGWLIFDAPEVEIGCHPSEKIFHAISFYCDAIETTVRMLRERGVQFTSDIKDEGWGLATTFRIPDGSEVTLYQPKYEKQSSG